MFSWLLRLALALLAIRFVARAIGRRPRTAPRPFDPDTGPDRARARDRSALSPYEIDDADYEELPRR